MKRIFYLLLTIVLTFGLAVTTQASLINNLDGTISQIRSDGSTLMWDQSANLYSGTWNGANAWIASLNNSNYKGYNDWRLPSTLPVNGTSYDYVLSYDGTTDKGYNIDSLNSEMGYMYYVELGNLGYCDTIGSCNNPGWGLNQTAPFTLQPISSYWSGTEYGNNAWEFNTFYGLQSAYYKNTNFRAWAVRSGDVAAAPIPEPSTWLLLSFGLLGLFAFKKKEQIHR